VRIWRGITDPIHLLSSLQASFADIVALRQGVSYAVFHPDYVKRVLQDNYPNYEKGERYRAALSPLMGNGLFLSEGPFWLRQRRLAQVAFQNVRTAAFDQPMLAHVARMLDAWAVNARSGQPVALRQELVDLTLRITLHIVFSRHADSQMPALIDAVQGVNQDVRFGTQFLPFHLPAWMPTPGRLRFNRSLRTIDEFVNGLVARRRSSPSPSADLVDLLLHARDDEIGEAMTDLQVRDELVTFLNAGHDTVTDAVLWTLVLLAQHPEAAGRVRQEIASTVGTAPLSFAALQGMPYLARVFHESLRLFPPAWGFARRAINGDTLGPYRIPAGALLVISPFVTHRAPQFWEQPEAFDPDRFLPERAAARPKFAYFPFGGGPRQCIGMGVAMMEAPLILASILQRFDVVLRSGTVVRPAPRISLRPEGTVWLNLREI
jgi:cytochrome P450